MQLHIHTILKAGALLTNSLPLTNAISTRQLCLTAVFAALICAGTLIMIPLPFGYFNLGDIFILCAAWSLGPVFGASAAAVGSALADILAGFAVYAPATFVIKGCIALSAALLFPLFSALFKKVLAAHICSAIIGESLMVLGYFVYESVFLGLGTGAAASIPGNTLQGVCGVIGASLLIRVLSANRTIRRMFR
ncbi:MAG: ECF transporter S component [Ruminococcaceae bacterium]|nr:ECF transporter S component [Oscillospiraceae bacterium]